MRILLSNDDGYFAPGLAALAEALARFGEIVVVAPEQNRSGASNSLTLDRPLMLKKAPSGFYFVNGTPTDCVHLAVTGMLDELPDIIVSGINLGSNAGINVIYSGTVSAATEGTILGIPSIAISLATYSDPIFEPAAEFAIQISRLVLKKGLPERTLLNINVPNVPKEQIRGIRITRQGMANFAELFDRRVDPRNRIYYWMDGKKAELEEGEDVDDVAIRENLISITPVKYDLTNYEFIPELQNWLKEREEK